MILATWLSQAASEEQTSVLNVILKVFSIHSVVLLHTLLKYLSVVLKVNFKFIGTLSLATAEGSPCTHVSNITRR